MDDRQRRLARLGWMLRRARLVEQINDARKHGSAVFNPARKRRLVPGQVQMRAAQRVERLQQQLKTFDDEMRRFFLAHRGK